MERRGLSQENSDRGCVWMGQNHQPLRNGFGLPRRPTLYLVEDVLRNVHLEPVWEQSSSPPSPPNAPPSLSMQIKASSHPNRAPLPSLVALVHPRLAWSGDPYGFQLIFPSSFRCCR
ncbi:hypothetical protein U9M48_044752 [Paspalum notatum var. saurae]|uniref:Uncharacterized protein n=1 Tax=Paspalum notatum var. saurae TaxID=547442 RepID=A0AAQ3XIL1_PASNO